MKILIKKVNNNNILYLQTNEDVNVECYILENKEQEQTIIDKLFEENNIFKFTDLRNKEVEYNINQSSPLILTFYLDRDLMNQREIISSFSQSVNNLIADRNINAIAFFLPTDNEERIECINPVLLSEPEIDNINLMISDIKNNFGM